MKIKPFGRGYPKLSKSFLLATKFDFNKNKRVNDSVSGGELVVCQYGDGEPKLIHGIFYVNYWQFYVDSRLSNTGTLSPVKKDGTLGKPCGVSYCTLFKYLGKLKVNVTVAG